jgi:hypothetical protein
MNWIKNQRGSIVFSLVISLVCAIAGLTMASRAFSTGQDFINDLILTQEMHGLRGQLKVGSVVASRLGDFVYYTLPDVGYQVDHGNFVRSYITRTKLSKALESTQYTAANLTRIKANIRCFNKAITSVTYHGNDENSHLQLYAEQADRKETFAGYMYLTNTDASENAAAGPEAAKVKFWGKDEIFGRVHSNSDIWIMNGGGGTNNGWPLFHDHVSTAGEVKWEGSTGNLDEIFLDGLTEETGEIQWNPQMSEIRSNGNDIFGGEIDADYIHVRMDGGAYVSKSFKVIWAPDTMIVRQFPGFPPYSNTLGDSIGFNTMSIPVDTVVTTLNTDGMQSGESILIHNKLYIEGRMRGRVTWGCVDTLFIVGDLTYEGTTPGETPDGTDENGDFVNPPNQRDFLGLVSEERIYIKYKCVELFEPEFTPGSTPIIKDDNCNDIFIYAALCALRQDEDPIKEGIFSFEYQHPHPSTPIVKFMLADTTLLHGRLSHFPDLHLNQYPWGNNWPTQSYNVINTMSPPDYPWYNPVWPELNVVGERGAIKLYGSVAQTRRGFVHRSGSDPANHDNGEWRWNDEVPKYGPTHPSSGYDKDYHYDYRFMRTPPPDFPEVHVTSGDSPRERVSLRYKVTPSNF